MSIKNLNLQLIFILFDEVEAALANSENKERKEMIRYYTQLILNERQAAINVILETQRPDADIIPANLKDQLAVRIGLGNLSKEGQKMAFGSLEREQNLLSNNNTTDLWRFFYIKNFTLYNK